MPNLFCLCFYVMLTYDSTSTFYRFNKKKKTKSYTRAVDEAKCDAVMHAQYVEALHQEPEEESTPTQKATLPSHEQSPPPAAVSASAHSSAQNPAESSSSDDSDSQDCHAPTAPVRSAAHRTVKAEELSRRGDSPSLLIDAFLRTGEQSSNALCTQLHEDYGNAVVLPVNLASQDTAAVDEDDDLEGCLTISLPSPRSLLNSGQ